MWITSTKDSLFAITMRKLLGIILLSLLVSGNAFAKKINIILDCKYESGEHFFVHIKAGKAKIDNFNVDMQVNENFIILDQKSYEINRYTLRFNHYYGNRAYPGACKKLKKKKI